MFWYFILGSSRLSQVPQTTSEAWQIQALKEETNRPKYKYFYQDEHPTFPQTIVDDLRAI